MRVSHGTTTNCVPESDWLSFWFVAKTVLPPNATYRRLAARSESISESGASTPLKASATNFGTDLYKLKRLTQQ
ncbi:uncharacterized protein Dvir_GJ27091 [Drosophila virilis]|uniref:Uncharacterized protein n=1 Tax=Drosophila virilis TaxID=7244 RepID=A0A0Q9WWQ2_DROVI|nr:uncharacterized protein Dvir_GJ27091 [Drosophila virilis]